MYAHVYLHVQSQLHLHVHEYQLQSSTVFVSVWQMKRILYVTRVSLLGSSGREVPFKKYAFGFLSGQSSQPPVYWGGIFVKYSALACPWFSFSRRPEHTLYCTVAWARRAPLTQPFQGPLVGYGQPPYLQQHRLNSYAVQAPRSAII